MDPPKGSCLHNNGIYKSGTDFHLDNCTICYCKNSFLQCQRSNCPILLCKQEHQEHLPENCCAVCKTKPDEDEINTRIYQDYEGPNIVLLDRKDKASVDDERLIAGQNEKFEIFKEKNSCMDIGKTYKVSIFCV